MIENGSGFGVFSPAFHQSVQSEQGVGNIPAAYPLQNLSILADDFQGGVVMLVTCPQQ